MTLILGIGNRLKDFENLFTGKVKTETNDNMLIIKIASLDLVIYEIDFRHLVPININD